MASPDLSIYFRPIGESHFAADQFPNSSLGREMVVFRENFPIWKETQIAIIGVREDRLSRNNKGSANGADEVRKYLYRLFPPEGDLKICDLGNILPGDKVEDTYYALKSVVSQLVRNNVLPIIIGGSQDLTYANFSAYEKLEQTINLLSIDRVFDLGQEQNEFDSQAYLNKIILHEPNFLFNYSNIGFQTYFLSQTELELMEKLYFDTYRLGYFRNNMEASEPIIRNADVVSFDISAIRQSDAPGSADAGPNGFYGEEACQMCRYAGMNDKLTSIGFYEFNPNCDREGQTAHLLAQMIWCVVEGFLNRKKDFPFRNEKKYFRYQVVISDFEHEMTFFKSKVSDRWWMSVPFPAGKRAKFERHHLVPCAYSDYQLACAEEVPDLWWKTFQKIT